MSDRYNPFSPNYPVYKGMFAGRHKELIGIDKAFFQTKQGNPQNILIVGERGIGKSSLLLAARAIASSEDDGDKGNNFLTIFISLTDEMSLTDFAHKLQASLERSLSEVSKSFDVVKKIWKFAKTVEVAGTGIKKESDDRDDLQIIDDIVYSLISTVKTITIDSKLLEIGLTKKKDGLILIIDEADKASEKLKLGSFLKTLSEAMVAENAMNFMVVMAGLPEVRSVLRKSHESSLRLFNDYELQPLKKEEVRYVIESGIKESNQRSPEKEPITCEDRIFELIFDYSEGYPHFVQQVGYSSFESNNDNVLSCKDVDIGFFSPDTGALTLIGNKYYRHLYAGCNAEHKKILEILAGGWDSWTPLKEVQKQYTGKGNLVRLGTSLSALNKRGLVLIKEDSKAYRLQWHSFAFWIKMWLDKDKKTLSSMA